MILKYKVKARLTKQEESVFIFRSQVLFEMEYSYVYIHTKVIYTVYFSLSIIYMPPEMQK